MFRKNKQKPRSRDRQLINTDGRPPAVFSYYKSRRPPTGDSQAASKETLRPSPPRRSVRFMRKTTGILLITATLALVVVSLVVAPQPEIKVLGDKNSQFFLQDPQVYRSAAQQIIASTPLNRNKMTFDASEISSQMRQIFPELSAVSVSLPLMGWEPTVYVQAFSPSLVLIGGNSGDFVLDPAGRAFAPGSLRGSLDKLKVPIVRDQSGLRIEERQIALPSSQVAFISEIHRQLQAKNVPIVGITLPAGEGELEVQVKNKPYVVRFNLYGDAREGAGRYLAAVSYLESRNQVPNDYIDVRVDGRVFYR
jgi:hypothetical protein